MRSADAAGAALNLGATFRRRSLPSARALTTPASSAADADVGRRIINCLHASRLRDSEARCAIRRDTVLIFSHGIAAQEAVASSSAVEKTAHYVII
jgi:hypothetical protein